MVHFDERAIDSEGLLVLDVGEPSHALNCLATPTLCPQKFG